MVKEEDVQVHVAAGAETVGDDDLLEVAGGFGDGESNQ